MSNVKKLPKISLSLLLLTYTSLGWVLSRTNVQPFVWVLVAIANFVLVATLTSSWSKFANYSINFFTSNLKSFSFTVFAAFLFFLILAHFRMFLDILVIITATMLVRIDFQTAGYRDGLAFWIMYIFSLIGLAIGVLVENLMSYYLP